MPKNRKGFFDVPRSLCLVLAILLLLLPAVAFGAVNPVAFEQDPAVRSGLVRVCLASLADATTVDVQLSAAYRVYNSELALPANENITIGLDTANGNVTLSYADQRWIVGPETILLRSSKQASLTIKQATGAGSYPADLALSCIQNGNGYALRLIAYIHVEDYLTGVLSYAIRDTVPAEAVKAQAVVARTYTLRAMEARADEAYDVVDTGADQLYRGTPQQYEACKAAVSATSGCVLMYEGELARTCYTFSNGGQTESAENAWGETGYPYLTVQDDPFDSASRSAIAKTASIDKDLKNGSVPEGLLALLRQKAVEVLAQQGYAATADNTGLIWLDGVKLRNPKFASPSKLYTAADFSLMAETASATGGQQVVPVTVTAQIFGELEQLLDMNLQTNENEMWSLSVKDNTITLRAARFGHGVGMSQYGAVEMAEQGYAYDYILGFYYPGCTNVKMNLSTALLRETLEMSNATEPTLRPITTPRPTDTEPVPESPTTATDNASEPPTEAPAVRPTVTAAPVKETPARTQATPVPTVSPEPWQPGYAYVTANGFVNLRQAPSRQAAILTIALEGEWLQVLAEQDGWAQVSYNGVTAYAVRGLLSELHAEPVEQTAHETAAPALVATTVPEATPAPVAGMFSATVYAKSGTVNFREQPSKDSSVIMRLLPGAVVTVHGTVGEFSQVDYMGIPGYIMTEFLLADGMLSPVAATSAPIPTIAPVLTPAITPAATVLSATNAPASTPVSPQPAAGYRNARVTTNGGSLNLRENPYDTAPILARIPQCSVIQALELDEVWCSVRYNGFTGYAKKSFLTFGENYAPEIITGQMSVLLPEYSIGPAMVVTPSGSLNLRQKACPYSVVLALVPNRATVEVYSNEEGWALVTYREYAGYVSSDYLEMQPQGTATPLPAGDAETYLPEGYEPVQGVTAVVMVDALLRTAPAADGKVLGKVAAGTELPVLAAGPEWCIVAWQNLTAYLAQADMELQ